MSSQPQRRPLVELPLERFVQGYSLTSKSKSITHGQSSRNTFARHSRIPSSESDSWLSPSECKVAVPAMFKSPEALANVGLSWSPPESIAGRVPRASPLRRSFAAIQDSEPPGGGRFGTLGRVLYAGDDSRAGSKVMVPDSKIASSSNNTPMSPPSATSCPLAPSPEIKSSNPRLSSNVPEGVSDPSPVVTYSSHPNVPDAQSTPKRRVRVPLPSSRHYPGFDIVPDSPSRSAARLATSSATMGSESVHDEDEDKENTLSLPSRRPRGCKRKMEPIAEGSLELTNGIDRAEVQRNLDPGVLRSRFRRSKGLWEHTLVRGGP